MLSNGQKLAMGMAMAAVAVTGSVGAASNGIQDWETITTPPGITLQPPPGGGRGEDRNPELKGEKRTPGFLAGASGRRNPAAGFMYANAEGMTVYTYAKDTTPGKSSCVGECAKAWPPVVVPASAKAIGDWSIIAREDGIKQWAFQGKPLYSFAQETEIGASKGTGADGGAWKAVKLNPDGFVKNRPYGIGIADARTTSGYVLVNYLGSVAYAYNGNGAEPKTECATSVCSTRWEPLQAPKLAQPIGDFTLVSRPDGVRQWAYKGKALFSFSGDLMPGDIFGTAFSKDFEPAVIARNFTPSAASISFDPARGPIVTTKDGFTLYRLDTSFHTPDGHGLPGSQPGSSKVGFAMGTAACDANCLKTWKPFLAGPNDVPSAHWSIMVREDGRRQWAYKGFALYRYPGDKNPGERSGSDIYEILTSDSPAKDVYKESKFGQLTSRGSDSAANFWSFVEK